MHVDQIKPYMALGEPGELAGLEGWDKDINRIVQSREGLDGEVQYLVTWQGSEDRRWVSHSVLLAMCGVNKIEEFLQSQR